MAENNPMRNGAIILVDDDPDDHVVLKDALQGLGVTNEIVCFHYCEPAFEYLLNAKLSPFLILCDINMPVQTGLEFKTRIDANPELRRRSIPFIFYSTHAAQETVNRAYMTLTVQGFFKKPNTYEEMKNNLKMIVDYWTACINPNT